VLRSRRQFWMRRKRKVDASRRLARVKCQLIRYSQVSHHEATILDLGAFKIVVGAGDWAFVCSRVKWGD
jgi:hypothetical protein